MCRNIKEIIMQLCEPSLVTDWFCQEVAVTAARRGAARFRGGSPDFMQEEEVTRVTGQWTLWGPWEDRAPPAPGFPSDSSAWCPVTFRGTHPPDFRWNPNTHSVWGGWETGRGQSSAIKWKGCVEAESARGLLREDDGAL